MRLYDKIKIKSTILGVLLLGSGYSLTSFGQKLEENVKEQKVTVEENKASQKKIDKVANETDSIIDEYRNTLSKTENLQIYNNQLRELLKSQEDEKLSLNKQIGNIENTSRGVVPLMISMIDTLEKFVGLDVPFLPEERANRIENLKQMMKRADVSTSEKYRRVLEAYQVENEYGRTIESYSGNLDIEGKSYAVSFLRVGRLTLMYQTIDGNRSGVWNVEANKWDLLDESYNKPVRQGIQIARKQSAPDLIEMPVKAAEVL